MDIEKQRGISISSTVLMYEYLGRVVSILDTPGHQDFSEDTYRTLAAADNAVMLIDAAKGLEPQTKKLFEVAHLRRLPLFTFVNKLDRPSLSPFEVRASDAIFAVFWWRWHLCRTRHRHRRLTTHAPITQVFENEQPRTPLVSLAARIVITASLS
eukprot:18740-Pleurochrysis_carterae.AAC.1